MPTVFITGSNRGIGLELARQYAAEGWRVLATCRQPRDADALSALKGDIAIYPLDVTDDRAVHALSGRFRGEAIDILYNNAGIIGGRMTFGATETALWQHVFHVNCIAPLHIIEALAGQVAASDEKKIISISTGMSSFGRGPSGGYYDYRTAKAALNLAIVNAAADLRPRGVILALIDPGWVKTDMGGVGATITPQQSVSGIRAVAARLNLADSGRFFNYRGEPVLW